MLYARVSRDDRGKDCRNLTGQIEMCREYAEDRGWRIVKELSEDDRGASGASFELPELSRALEMAQTNGFDVLVVREIDRLSRKLAKQLIVEEELKRHGVEIEYVLGEYPDTPEGNLQKHIKAAVAEYERLKILERMGRGRDLKVKSGSVLVYSRPPFGYRVIEDDGKWKLEVDEAEAKIVRLIYTWYAHGDEGSGPVGTADIARRLTKMGVPTYTDSRFNGNGRHHGPARWSRSTLYGMLDNQTYSGTWHFGKSSKPDDQLIAVKVPAIVTPELWEAVQAERKKRRQHGKRNPKYQYLLSRRIACGFCGMKAHGNPRTSNGYLYLYYVCNAATLGFKLHS